MENRLVYKDPPGKSSPEGDPQAPLAPRAPRAEGMAEGVPEGRRGREMTNTEVRKKFLDGLALAPEQKDFLFGKILEDFKKNGEFNKVSRTDDEKRDFVERIRKNAYDVAFANSDVWSRVNKVSAPEALRQLLESGSVDLSLGVATVFVEEVAGKLDDVLKSQPVVPVGQVVVDQYFTVDYIGGMFSVRILNQQEKEALEKQKTDEAKKGEKPDEADAAKVENRKLAEAMAKKPFYSLIFGFLGIIKPEVKDGPTIVDQYEKILSGENPIGWIATLFLPLPGNDKRREEILVNAGSKRDVVEGVFEKVDGFLSPFKSFMELDTGVSAVTKKVVNFIKEKLAPGKAFLFSEDSALAGDEKVASGFQLAVDVPKGSFVDLKAGPGGSGGLGGPGGPGGLKVKNLLDGKELAQLGRLDATSGPMKLAVLSGGTLGKDTVFGKGVSVVLNKEVLGGAAPARQAAV